MTEAVESRPCGARWRDIARATGFRASRARPTDISTPRPWSHCWGRG